MEIQFEYEIKDGVTGEVRKITVPASKVSDAEKHWKDINFQIISKRDKVTVGGPAVSEENVLINEAQSQIGDTGYKSSLMGGLLQGISLGAEDEVEILGPQSPAEKELLRKRQEAEHPVVYGIGRAIGGIIPGAMAGGSGAYLGGLGGAAIGGPPGAAIGALIGGGLGAAGAGTADSILSKDQGSEIEASDFGWGAISGGLNVAGDIAAPAIRKIKAVGQSKLLDDVAKAGTAGAYDIQLSLLNKQLIDLDAQIEILKQAQKRAWGIGGKVVPVKVVSPELSNLIKQRFDIEAAMKVIALKPEMQATGATLAGAASGSAVRAIPEEEEDAARKAEMEARAIKLAVDRLNKKKTKRAGADSGESEPDELTDTAARSRRIMQESDRDLILGKRK
jgi:hypothetical protein